MLQAITVLLVFQLIGEVVSQAFDQLVPGPVVGMGLFFAALTHPRLRSAELRRTARNLLQHLLLFAPAGAGVTLPVQRVAVEWWPITLSVSENAGMNRMRIRKYS